MTNKLISMSDEDLSALRALLADWRSTRENTSNRGAVEPDIRQSPEVFVALTPRPGGIPAMFGHTGTGTGADEPGSAWCGIYRVLPAEPTVGTSTFGGIASLMRIGDRTELVYNLSFDGIASDIWIVVVRSKTGEWLAAGALSGGGGSASVAHVALTPAGMGIPALTGHTGTGIDTDEPGQAVCELYEILPGLVAGLSSLNQSVTVYNLSRTAIPGDTWIIIVQDPFGSWLVTGVYQTAGGGGGGTGTGTGTGTIGLNTTRTVVVAFDKTTCKVTTERWTFVNGKLVDVD